jgi:hypothetical protein
MFDGYGQSFTRSTEKEIVDKLGLVDASATEYANNRVFADFVLRKVAKADSAAVSQIQTWVSFVESLKYRREYNEVLRNPITVAGAGGQPATGGDCDDLTVVVLAGLRSLAFECYPEVLANENKEGFHIRAVVGLPAVNPTEWRIVDPVWWGEKQWAQSIWTNTEKPLSIALSKQVTGLGGHKLAGNSGESQSKSLWILPLLLILGLSLLSRQK